MYQPATHDRVRIVYRPVEAPHDWEVTGTYRHHLVSEDCHYLARPDDINFAHWVTGNNGFEYFIPNDAVKSIELLKV